MIPENIIDILDKPGIEWEQTETGVVPVVSGTFYLAVAALPFEQRSPIARAVSDHCQTYSRMIMDAAFVPLYGFEWRMNLVTDPDRRFMGQILMKQVLAEANLGAYIRGIQA